MCTELFIFRLDPALKGALAKKARTNGQSMAELVRAALRETVTVH